MNSSKTDRVSSFITKSNKSRSENPYSIIAISMKTSNSYLIVLGGNWILVDTGYKGNIKNLKIALEKNNLTFLDIVLIVLTHTHYYHVGSLDEVKGLSASKVLVHAAEKEYLERGMIPSPKGTMWFSKIISEIGSILIASNSRYQPVSSEIVVNGEYDLGKYIPSAKVIPTPGHTDGSISLVIDNEVAFVGDTLFNVIPGTVFPPFANNVSELLKSWEKLINTGCKTFYPGHEKPIPLQKLKDLYTKKKAA